LNFDYHGFVEGDDITKGTVDVVVTDGFTGNVALKTGEGVARWVRGQLRREFTAGPLARLAAAIMQCPLRAMANRLNGASGGPFLGLNGIVVKAHGGVDANGFGGAVRLAVDLAARDFATESDRSLKQLAAPSIS
jgi:glycerol-3-phosphate acyltransferase PlsX